MKAILILSTFFLCSFHGFQNCPTLKTIIVQGDQINPEDDAEYGVGDDDLFTGNECNILKSGNNSSFLPIKSLNDYNFQTSYRSNFNATGKDTLYVTFDFRGMKSIKSKHAININKISFINGERKSLTLWKKSQKVNDVQFVFQGKCIGSATLANTYKKQNVLLGNEGINISNKLVDTLKIIIVNQIDKSKGSSGYSLSEIMFDGHKNY